MVCNGRLLAVHGPGGTNVDVVDDVGGTAVVVVGGGGPACGGRGLASDEAQPARTSVATRAGTARWLTGTP